MTEGDLYFYRCNRKRKEKCYLSNKGAPLNHKQRPKRKKERNIYHIWKNYGREKKKPKLI